MAAGDQSERQRQARSLSPWSHVVRLFFAHVMTREIAPSIKAILAIVEGLRYFLLP
jgi:hypothetical protein